VPMTNEEAKALMARLEKEACCPLQAAAWTICRKCKRKQATWQAAKVWRTNGKRRSNHLR
jgi:hypothetical protein